MGPEKVTRNILVILVKNKSNEDPSFGMQISKK